VTKWTPPLPVAELARTASRLARGARHIETTWGEPGAALSQREPARLGGLHIRLGASVGIDEGDAAPAPPLETGSVENVLASRPELS
jgi:hypothetical protein